MVRGRYGVYLIKSGLLAKGSLPLLQAGNSVQRLRHLQKKMLRIGEQFYVARNSTEACIFRSRNRVNYFRWFGSAFGIRSQRSPEWRPWSTWKTVFRRQKFWASRIRLVSQRYRSRSSDHQAKIVRKTFISSFSCFVTFLWPFIYEE